MAINDGIHANSGDGENHRISNFTFDTEAGRTGHTYHPDDLYKVAAQTDTATPTFWVITGVDGGGAATFQPLGGGGGPVFHGVFSNTNLLYYAIPSAAQGDYAMVQQGPGLAALLFVWTDADGWVAVTVDPAPGGGGPVFHGAFQSVDDLVINIHAATVGDYAIVFTVTTAGLNTILYVFTHSYGWVDIGFDPARVTSMDFSFLQKRIIPTISFSQTLGSYDLDIYGVSRVFLWVDSPQPRTLTVPSDAVLGLSNQPNGQQFSGRQAGAGQVTLAADAGVTVVGSRGLRTRAQYSPFTLTREAENFWVADGDLVP